MLFGESMHRLETSERRYVWLWVQPPSLLRRRNRRCLPRRSVWILRRFDSGEIYPSAHLLLYIMWLGNGTRAPSHRRQQPYRWNRMSRLALQQHLHPLRWLLELCRREWWIRLWRFWCIDRMFSNAPSVRATSHLHLADCVHPSSLKRPNNNCVNDGFAKLNIMFNVINIDV